MPTRRLALVLLAFAAACGGGSPPAAAPAPKADDAMVARARAIHERVLTLDTHVDINPGNFRTDTANYGQRLDRTQVDLAKMEKGGLDAVFLVVFVGQAPELNAEAYAKANAAAMEKFTAIHRFAEQIAPDRVGLALSAADARRLYASGKKVVFIGVENGFPVGTDVTNVKKFHDLGARYMSLAHNGHSQLSDSNTGERDGVWLHHGLSPLGRQVIAEMNRQGIMVDISHPSKESMMQTLAITKAPIIASHSGVRAICGHSRNLDDEQLLALKKNNGVAQLVAFNSYVKCDAKVDAARLDAQDALRKEFGIGAGRGAVAQIAALPADRKAAFEAKQAEILKKYPALPRATVQDFVNHIDYAVKLIGIEHVGISSDFDGGGGVEGWSSAEETFNVTLELVRRGYTEEQIAKMWSGNLLRVLEDVEKVAQQLQRGEARTS